MGKVYLKKIGRNNKIKSQFIHVLFKELFFYNRDQVSQKIQFLLSSYERCPFSSSEYTIYWQLAHRKEEREILKDEYLRMAGLWEDGFYEGKIDNLIIC